MAEYIEREKVGLTDFEIVMCNCDYKEALKMLLKKIEFIPAADVVEVVRCKDCKYAPIGDKDGNDLEWPFNEFDENPCPYKCLDNWYSHKPAPGFFCAAGEKREES